MNFPLLPEPPCLVGPAEKDISANSGSNVMSDLYLADIRSGEESAQSDLLLGGLLPISDSGTSLLFFLTRKAALYLTLLVRRVHSLP